MALIEFHNLKKIILVFNFFIVSSCVQQVSPDYSREFSVPDIPLNGNEKYLDAKSDYIFDQESLHTFRLDIPSSALQKIDSDPAKEEYVEGMLIFKGDTFPHCSFEIFKF